MTLKLILPFPPTVNTYWRFTGKGVLISASGRSFRKNAIAAVIEQLKKIPRAITGNVQVTLILNPPDRCRRDLDNYLKAIFDSLTHAGVWEDDSQVKKMEVEWGPVVTKGKVEITISAYKPAVAAA